MNRALSRVAGIRSTKLLVSSQSRYRTYAIRTAVSKQNARKLVETVASHKESVIEMTLDEEFAAREAELLPSPIDDVDEDPQLGDYPIVRTSNQLLPPRGWWDQQARRNFGDPVPEYDEVLSMWGPDVSAVSPQKALYQFSLVALGFVSFGIFCKYALVPDRPAVPREYPFSGLITELGGLEENKAREEELENDDE